MYTHQIATHLCTRQGESSPSIGHPLHRRPDWSAREAMPIRGVAVAPNWSCLQPTSRRPQLINRWLTSENCMFSVVSMDGSLGTLSAFSLGTLSAFSLGTLSAFCLLVRLENSLSVAMC
jgi:hypothetical protein